MRFRILLAVLFASIAMSGDAGRAQDRHDLAADLKTFAEASGVAGYEDEARGVLLSLLPDEVSPKVDEMGNVVVTLGDGSPHTVVICHYDEMGYVVTRITEEGFLRVSRIGNFPESPFYDLFHEGQLLQLITPRGKLPAAAVVTSVHLRGKRPQRFSVEDMWIDVGANSAEEARELGVDLLQPLQVFKEVRRLGSHRIAGPAVGDRFGALAMVEALRRLQRAPLAGTVTFAWTVQGNLLSRGYGAGAVTGRGARRVATALASAAGEPVRVLVVDRFVPRMDAGRKLTFPQGELGKGVLLSAAGAGSGYSSTLLERAREVARRAGVPVQLSLSGGANAAAAFSGDRVQRLALGVPVRYSGTDVEMIDLRDLQGLSKLVAALVRGEGDAEEY